MKYLFAIAIFFTTGMAISETIVTFDGPRGGTQICNIYCSPDGKDCRVVCI